MDPGAEPRPEHDHPGIEPRMTSSSGMRERVRDTLTLAVFFALVSATCFVGVNTVRLFARGLFAPASRDYVWMSPLGYLCFFLVAAVPVLALVLVMQRRRALAVAAFALGALATFNVFIPLSGVRRIAAVLCTIGIAAELARQILARPDAALRFMRRASAALAGIFLVAGVASGVWWRVAERRAVASTPAATAGAPNVLLLILDTVRASNLSLYGYARATTPNIARFAERGTTFDMAISTASWTLPSHGTDFTGQYPGKLSTAEKKPFDATFPTLAEAFRERGYETVGMAGNYYFAGWDSGLRRGFARYRDYRVSFRQVLWSSWIGQSIFVWRAIDGPGLLAALRQAKTNQFISIEKPDAEPVVASDIVDGFLAWERERPTGAMRRPYFAFLNFFDAHEPYSPPPSMRTRFAAKPGEMDLYDAAIAHLDEEIARMLGALERRGALDNTLVVITSDHGEQFGEHGLVGHGNSLYLPLLHVPLVVVFDGRVPRGGRVAEPVSMRDLAATVADLALPGGAHPFPGVSLARRWSGDGASLAGSPVIAEQYKTLEDRAVDPMKRAAQQALFADGWHYIRNLRSKKEELYAPRDDPSESRNLVRTPEGRAVADSLRARLAALLASDGAPGQPTALAPAPAPGVARRARR
jgi:arylsulfatase A-like enzyme